ncbi:MULTISPECIES: hypothetical protein [Paenibacillus]|jgi:hypothetical protein|uniref:Barstar (barnase inhibitor) domain-containing protein n=2 Tax=Paenibacillus TaxID=44249 RepID=A0ABX2ZDD0_PAEPO|nr:MULTISPECIES: hypothetical protein [Paenibacillus]MDR6777701.1 hypothetical protein [Paenibacillus peoriae]ODA08574.1 hypothetical protein A7312_04005 [Paenibacillus polymyxa]OME65933.1 hypothetical protein BK119_23695 [Paenibacillus peoriae]OMF34070.1 hypothetical protein BK134_10200 [Paenibacillus peoriae]
MSVSVMILEPQNEFEKSFFFPVASESFFNECWQPAIESLGLQWIDLFSTGVDVEEEDLPIILSELRQLQNWAERNLEEDHKNKLVERVITLIEKLPSAFQRKEAVVFIG